MPKSRDRRDGKRSQVAQHQEHSPAPDRSRNKSNAARTSDVDDIEPKPPAKDADELYGDTTIPGRRKKS